MRRIPLGIGCNDGSARPIKEDLNDDSFPRCSFDVLVAALGDHILLQALC
jgi:hypothetical protein